MAALDPTTAEKVFDGIINYVMGSTADTIVKGVVILVLGVVFFFAVRWMNAERNRMANEKTEQGRSEDQASIVDKNKEIFNDAQTSEESIEELIKQRESKK